MNPYARSFLYSDPTLYEAPGPAPIQGREASVRCSLWECPRCQRLLEGRRAGARTLAPDACYFCRGEVVPLVGREVDGYVLDEEIAAGGFGILFLASNAAEPGMKAVVKLLRPSLAWRHPALVKVFVEEARLTEEIGRTCWNIVRVSNVRERPWPYFFMEYVRGASLDDAIKARDGKLPLAEAKGYLRGIAKALAATHARGRVHRDLKPMNVMILAEAEVARPEDRVKLLDFGLALSVAARGVKAEVKAGEKNADPIVPEVDDAAPRETFDAGQGATIVASPADSLVRSGGTPEYMAPEAFDGSSGLATDVYSFGVTAFEALSGELPWDDPPEKKDRFLHWRDAHKGVRPAPLRAKRPDAPRWLSRLVADCLEKDPARRVASAARLVERLREPIPRWIWAAAAALVLIVPTLAWYAVKGTYVHDAVVWSLDGEARPGDPLELWVRSEGDLPDREVVAKVPRAASGAPREVRSCRASDPGVRCEVREDLVRVRLPREAGLVGSTVSIEGDGDGFRFRGAINVRLDDEPPVVRSIVAVDGKGGVLELAPGARLQPDKASLRADVEEPRLRSVVLRYERDGDTGEVAESSGVFPLKGLSGGWRLRIVAVDQAGNRTVQPTEGLEVTLDGSLGLRFLDEKRPWAARGRDFFPFEVDGGESIGSLEARDWVSGASMPVEIYASPEEVKSPADLLGNLVPVKADALRAGTRWLLAVPVEAQALPMEIHVEARDTAWPPNRDEWQLEPKAPWPFLASDLESISILPRGAPSAVVVSGSDFVRDGEPTKPITINTPRIQSIDVRTAPDRAILAKLRIENLERVQVPTSTGVRFEGIELQPDYRNRVHLSLQGASGEPSEVSFLVIPDTIAPKLEARALSRDGRDYFESAKEASFVLEAGEPLVSAFALVAGKRVRLEFKPIEGNQFEVSDLGALGLSRDGPHDIAIAALDAAGNEGDPAFLTIVIDSKPPSVTSTMKQDVLKTLLLDGSTVLFRVADANGVDPKGAECRIEYQQGDEPPHELKQPLTVATGGDFEASLAALPDRCRGHITVFVADKYGLRSGGSNDDRFAFDLVRPEPSWRPELEWRGVVWVLVRAPKPFYITKTEVSNGRFNDPAFIREGAYVADKLKGKYARPRYWGPAGELPSYVSKDGSSVAGHRFPVVGVSPIEAEAFAADVLGGRLPLWSEMLMAATLENPGGRFPWKDAAPGRDWMNIRGARERAGSPFREHAFTAMRPAGGAEVLAAHVEVDFPPFPPEVLAANEPFTRIWHLLGNVRELVRLQNGGYGAAGGHYDSEYEEIRLDRDPDPYRGDDLDRRAKTGFRVVIPLDGAPPELKAAAAVRP